MSCGFLTLLGHNRVRNNKFFEVFGDFEVLALFFVNFMIIFLLVKFDLFCEVLKSDHFHRFEEAVLIQVDGIVK